MKKDSEAFIGIDTAKARNAVAVAEGGRNGEVRYLGESDNTSDGVAADSDVKPAGVPI